MFDTLQVARLAAARQQLLRAWCPVPWAVTLAAPSGNLHISTAASASSPRMAWCHGMGCLHTLRPWIVLGRWRGLSEMLQPYWQRLRGMMH